jgi:predicted HTH domain antitoxin
MQTFSIRDLRDRSGELTHEAEEGRMSLVTKHGQPLFVTLPFTEDLLQHGVRKSLAMTLLRAGDISIGKAAEIAGMSYMDFLPLVKALGMYVVDYDPAELADELKLLGG